MAITQVLLICLGFCLLAKHADAAPVLSANTATVAENSAAGTLATLATTGSVTGITLTSQTNTGQLTATLTGTDMIVALVAGYTLDYETDQTVSLVATLTDGSATITSTVTITVTDVTDEYSSTQMFACLSGTTYAAAATLTTVTITSTTSATYTISSQPATNLVAYSAAGVLTVASGKEVKAGLIDTYTLTLQSVAGGTTSTTSLTIAFGCSSSGAPAMLISMVTLMLAMLVAMLQ